MSHIEDRALESRNAQGAIWILLEKLNTFLEQMYCRADIETGC